MISEFWMNARMFWQSARLSYIALFRWLNPPTYVASKILMPMNQLVFFTLLGIYASGRENSHFYVIGNALQITAISGIFGVSMTVGDDRRTGTLPYLFGVPSSRLFIFLGRAVFHIFDGALGVVMSLVLGALLFGVDLSHANLPALGLVIIITTISTCGFGLMLGSLSLITVNAMFIGNVFYFLLLAFSGANIPLENMPDWVQAVSQILPLTRGLEAARQIIAGERFNEVLPLLAGEVLIGAVYTTFGYVLFRWIEEQARRLGTLESF